MTIELRGGYRTDDPRLDRIPQADPRNAAYPISRAFIGLAAPPPLRSFTWAVGAQRLSDPQVYLDQGREGACVGFAFAHEAAARPEVIPGVDDMYARRLYYAAQRIDPWDGGAYPGAFPFYDGTSVLAGAQALKAAGAISGYLWAHYEPDMARAVGYRGPVVLGVDWFEGMYDPDQDGFLNMTGDIVGGHAILCIGIDVRRQAYVVHNSWGPGWGVRGRALIRRADMERQIAAGADVCLPVRLRQH